MFFVITLVYILSFLPHLAMMIYKLSATPTSHVTSSHVTSSHVTSSETWLVARNLVLRSYFINSVANPIVYSFCSQTFAQDCRAALRMNRT